MRKLHRNNAVGLEQNLYPFDKIIYIRILSQHIIAYNQICILASLSQFACQSFTKKLHNRRNTFADSNTGHISCRLYTKYGYILLDKMVQQITVIAG